MTGSRNTLMRPLFAVSLAAATATLAACGSAREPVAGAPAVAVVATQRLPLYVGTYTDAGSPGIYRSELDTGAGTLSEPILVGEAANPSFLALHPSGRVLYAVNELADYGGARTGAVSAFAIDAATGALTPLGQQPSGGANPCHIAVDRAGRHVLVANYTGGSVAVLPLAADGRLLPASAFLQLTGSGPNLQRQEGPHAHQIVLDPAERFALVADLGTDRILVYRFDPARGTLEPNDPPAVALAPGSGPRHLAWHPSGLYLYALSEMASTVTVLRWDAVRGALAALQTVTTLPSGFAGTNTAAEIAVSGDGRFLYASNRGDDSLAVFTVEPAAGTLAAAGRVAAGGRAPRHFTFDPSGRWLLVALQGSDSLQMFRVDPASGLPSPSGRPLAVSRPVCVVFAGL
jgi:6-phosphogluconolactonase